MDERQASALALSLCGRRLQRRRTHAMVGAAAVAVAALLSSALAITTPQTWTVHAWSFAALLGVAGCALFLHGRRFPTYADAYRDLGLDPLTPLELADVDQLLALRPDLRSTVACWAAYDVPLRTRDLSELRRLASLDLASQGSDARYFA